jgi:transcriptional regulator with XRE-family HTH domain
VRESERFGRNVRAWRQARGLSLRAAAEEIGIAFSTLDRLERGVADLPVLRVLRWMQSDAETSEWRSRALIAERTLATVQHAVHEYEGDA